MSGRWELTCMVQTVHKPTGHWWTKLWENMKKYPQLYLMALPVLLWYVVFQYGPMYGLIIAFQRYVPSKPILANQFVGLKNFRDFLADPYFLRVLRNTLTINFYLLIFAFPAAILFALLLNELRAQRLKKLTQTVTYMPHFISAMVICGLAVDFFKADGMLTSLLVSLFGVEKTNLLSVKGYFQPIYVALQIWQETGWDSIIFVAALAGIDPTLYEAAIMDGAGRFRRAWSITLPSIMPTIVILLILRIGNMMTLGWEKIVLLYNQMTYETADVISTYVYRRGLIQFDYSFSAAVGFFNSIINFILLIGANALSRRVNETSLW